VAIIAIVISYAILATGGAAGGSLIAQHGGYFAAMAKAGVGVLVKIGIATGFATGVANGLLNGASLGESLIMGVKGAIFGGLSAGLAHGIGTVFAKDALMRAISHGVVRGILGRAQGGNFGSGFMSGFASSALGNITKGLKNMHTAMKLSFHALVGGTVSAIGGGKFANGAVSAAVVYLFNDASHNDFTKEGKYNYKYIKNLKVTIDKMNKNSILYLTNNSNWMNKERYIFISTNTSVGGFWMDLKHVLISARIYPLGNVMGNIMEYFQEGLSYVTNKNYGAFIEEDINSNNIGTNAGRYMQLHPSVSISEAIGYGISLYGTALESR